MDQCYGIIEALSEIQNRHTGLTLEQHSRLYGEILEVAGMEKDVESLEGETPQALYSQMNGSLSGVQRLLLELMTQVPEQGA